MTLLMIWWNGQVTDNQISDNIKSETSEAVASTSHNLTQFTNCEDAMKEKLDDEEIRDVVPHVVTSLDEPVTYAEFFVWKKCSYLLFLL